MHLHYSAILLFIISLVVDIYLQRLLIPFKTTFLFYKIPGKSLYIKRLYENLKHSTKKSSVMKCIRLIEPNVDENVILQSLLNTPKTKEVMIFHFDITSSVIMSYKLVLSWVIHTQFSHNSLILLALT